MLTGIRKKFHRYFLDKELKHHFADHHSVNLKNAKDVGILFSVADSDEAEIIAQCAATIRTPERRTHLLGFYDSPKSTLNFTFPTFNRKNLNWYLEPGGPHVNDFIRRRFDILIGAFAYENLPLEFICALSNAAFRVGPYRESKTYCFDFMVDTKGATEMKEFFKQVNHYLNMI